MKRWRSWRLGNEVFDKIAALPFPTVAMIHGFCMGGGTELALACKYRVTDDGPKTRMALPEVMLGIVPGWGGAKRMPPLIGAAAALDLMLTGRGVDGRRAKKLGLVDAVTPEAALRQRGADDPEQSAAASPRDVHAAATNWPGVRDIVAKMSAKQVAASRAPRPVSGALRDHRPVEGLRRRPAQDPPRASRLDREPFLPSDGASNLIRIFKLQERLKKLGSDPGFSENRGLTPV